MPLSASLLNRPCSSTPSYVRSPRIWSHCVPTAANLALENVAQKTINYLPILVVKCTPYHTETVRRINPKCALSSRHSQLTPTQIIESRLRNLLIAKQLYTSESSPMRALPFATEKYARAAPRATQRTARGQ